MSSPLKIEVIPVTYNISTFLLRSVDSPVLISPLIIGDCIILSIAINPLVFSFLAVIL